MTLIACSSGAGRDGRSLLLEAAARKYPPMYRFVERPDLAGLLECIGGPQTIGGVVAEGGLVAAFGVLSGTFLT